MKNPKTKFVISANEDIKNYILFNRYSGEYLRMFLPKELHYIVKKKFSEKRKEKIIRDYIKHNFKINKGRINKNVKEIKKHWKMLEKRYFALVGRVFKNYPWSKGKYTGFASVFSMYPRNIKEKIFYFPVLRKDLNFCLAVIAHEMLHFIFFDYIKEKYNVNENKEFKNKDPKYVWNISEVFNLVIENWKPYQRIFKTKSKPYDTTHTKIFSKMKKLWKEKKDIDYLLDYYFKS